MNIVQTVTNAIRMVDQDATGFQIAYAAAKGSTTSVGPGWCGLRARSARNADEAVRPYADSFSHARRWFTADDNKAVYGR